MGCRNIDIKYLDLDRWHHLDVNPGVASDKSRSGCVERVVVGRCWSQYLFATERTHVDGCNQS